MHWRFNAMTTLSIRGLKPAQLSALAKRAKDEGKSTTAFVRALIERELASQTFDQLLRPIRDDFRKNGITPDQLDRLVNQARKAIHTGAGTERVRRK
jgi:hypothetical protein